MTIPTNQEDIGKILEQFYRDYEEAMIPVLAACKQEKITVDEQVDKSYELWTKAMKTATQAINTIIANKCDEARIDEHIILDELAEKTANIDADKAIDDFGIAKQDRLAELTKGGNNE